MISRTELEKFIFEKHASSAEHPWEKYPDYSVFRRNDNKKWFAVIMRIPISKFGILENRQVNVINLKCTEEAMDRVWLEDGIFPAYHMNKDHWISVLLDGSVSIETVEFLIDVSFQATAPKTKKKR